MRKVQYIQYIIKLFEGKCVLSTTKKGFVCKLIHIFLVGSGQDSDRQAQDAVPHLDPDPIRKNERI
jgi:hypothetical protein